MGSKFEQSARPKSDLYSDLLPLLNARRIELLDHPRLSAQFAGLERRNGAQRAGLDRPCPGAGMMIWPMRSPGVLVGLDLDRRPALVRIEDVVGADGKGEAAQPRWLSVCVYAMIVDAGADIAVVYCGSIRNDSPERGVRQTLWVLDLDVRLFQAWIVGRAYRAGLKAMAQPGRGCAGDCSRPDISPFGFQIQAASGRRRCRRSSIRINVHLCCRMHRRRISEVLSGGDREDEDSDDRRSVGAESWRSGRDGVESGADRSDFR